jgi:hypothetical protein
MRLGQILEVIAGAFILVLGLLELALMAEAASLINTCASTTNCTVSGVDPNSLMLLVVLGIVAVVSGIVLVAIGLRSEPTANPVAPGIVACAGCGRKYRVGQARFCLSCGSRVG